MFARFIQTAWFRRPALRRVMAALCVLIYLTAGALHGACDIDVTKATPHGPLVISAVSDIDSDTANKAMIADHHCHGCFSVSIPSPPATAEHREFARPVRYATEPARLGTLPRLDTPPPKHLA